MPRHTKKAGIYFFSILTVIAASIFIAIQYELIPVTFADGENIILTAAKSPNVMVGSGWTYVSYGYLNGWGEYYTAPGSGLNTVTFTSPVASGIWRVSATWMLGSRVGATNVPYTFLDGTTNRGTLTVDQSSLEGPTDEIYGTNSLGSQAKWQIIGDIEVRSGQISIKVSDNANGYVYADSIRLNRIGDVPDTEGGATVVSSPPIEGAPINLSVSYSNAASLSNYNWTVSRNGQVVATATAATTSFTASDNGQYAVAFTAQNTSNGQTISANTTLTVANAAPVIKLDNNLYANGVNQLITFNKIITDASADMSSLQYAWNFGDGASSALSAGSHAYATAGRYTARLTVTDKDGGSATATALVDIINGGSGYQEPLNKPLLQPSDFTYVGSFKVPQQMSGSRLTSFSEGGLTYRYVNGQMRFFSVGGTQTGGNFVYEFTNPGYSLNKSQQPTAQIVKVWGDVAQGHNKFVDGSGNPANYYTLPIGQLHYENGRLYYTFLAGYNTQNGYAPSIGYATLDDATGVATGVGEWFLQNIPGKQVQQGVTEFPQWFADRFSSGQTLAAGCGGYYSIVGAGGSLGPSVVTFKTPDPAVNPEYSGLQNTPLLGYTGDGIHSAQRDPYYTTYFGGLAPQNIAPGQGTYYSHPQSTTPHSQIGYWTWNDTIGGTCMHIDTGTKQGFLTMATVGRGIGSYQVSTVRSQGLATEWFLYKPADLAAVALRSIQTYDPQPYAIWTEPLSQRHVAWGGQYEVDDGQIANGLTVAMPGAQPSLNSPDRGIGGAVFDPVTNLLYVNNPAGWSPYSDNHESFPEIAVYRIGNPPAPDTTAPSTPTSLTATATSLTQINLSWNASTDNTAIGGYKIFRNGSQIGASSTNSFSNTGLTAGTSYSYTVSAYDVVGNNSSQSSSASATTQTDSTPPVISSVAAANITGSAALISWTTNESATTQIEYGLTTSYGSSTTLDSSLITSHAQSLAGLTSGMTYHYRVKSRDFSNNLQTSPDYTFTTSASNVPPPPPTAYTITASAGTNGSISPMGTVLVVSGSGQTFTISPNASFSIANVLVDNVSVGTPSSYTFSNVTANHTISATFAISAVAPASPNAPVSTVNTPLAAPAPNPNNPYFTAITLNTVAPNGKVTRTPDKIAYAYAESVTLTAVPDFGYMFVGWSGDLAGSANPIKITMDKGKVIYAKFELIPNNYVNPLTQTPPTLQTPAMAAEAPVAAVAINAPAIRLEGDLKINDYKDDVQRLQKFLNSNGYTITSTGFGSPGYETNFFGQKTADALRKFQGQYLAQIGISSANGVLDEKTRAYVNSFITASAPIAPAQPATDRTALIEQIKAQIAILQQQLIVLLTQCAAQGGAVCY